jgi:hypothetical protein
MAVKPAVPAVVRQVCGKPAVRFFQRRINDMDHGQTTRTAGFDVSPTTSIDADIYKKKKKNPPTRRTRRTLSAKRIAASLAFQAPKERQP